MDGLETYFAEHRRCAALAAAIVQTERAGASWAVARLECTGCGVRWERHLKLSLLTRQSPPLYAGPMERDS